MPRTDLNDDENRFEDAINAVHDDDAPPSLDAFTSDAPPIDTIGEAPAPEKPIVTAQQTEPWRIEIANSEGRLRAERERDDARRELEALRKSHPVVKAPEPDFFADPAAYLKAQIDAATSAERDRYAQQQTDMQGRMMFLARQHAESSYTPAVVNDSVKAIQEAERTGQIDQREAQRIMSSPNPFHEAVLWNRRQSVSREVGDDLAAYKQRIREEALADPEFVAKLSSDPAIQARVIAAARGQAAGTPAARLVSTNPAPKFPGSLSKTGTAATAATTDDESDDDRFNNVMNAR